MFGIENGHPVLGPPTKLSSAVRWNFVGPDFGTCKETKNRLEEKLQKISFGEIESSTTSMKCCSDQGPDCVDVPDRRPTKELVNL